MSQPTGARPPSPTLFFETINAYQRTEALKGAIQLDLFSAIGAGAETAGEPWKVLDIAAGHGLFGIAVARQNPNSQIVALDWSNVLAVAQENARAAGLGDRYHTLPGSAFEVDYGGDYDLVLLTNFLHHFD